MAHPSRRAFVQRLRRDLPARVVWDRRNDRWDTGRRSMLAFDPTAEWHVVTQDDAIVCRDFVPGVAHALAAVGDHPVAFYMGRVRPHVGFVRKMHLRADKENARWIAMRGPWWGVSVAVRTERIPEMVKWCDQRDVPNYDLRMTRYWESLGIECWYSVPSLVDHRVGDENPSLVPGRGNSPSRVAFRFIGDRSPLEVDWRTDAVCPTSGPGAIRRGRRVTT
jgi:hypothetical protein